MKIMKLPNFSNLYGSLPGAVLPGRGWKEAKFINVAIAHLV
jgi:hypothetical protein